MALQGTNPSAWRCKARFKFSHKPSNAPAAQTEIGFEEAIRIKSAGFWLKLAQPDQALREIKSLPERLQNHPSVLKTHLAAIRAVRELSEHSTTNNCL